MKTPSASNQEEKVPRADTSREMLERIFKIAALVVKATKDTGEICLEVQSEGVKTQK